MHIEVADRKLSKELEALKPVILQIAETFGADCEVVLHDFTHPKSSVVMVANGEVTGRRVGQAFSDLMSILRSPHFQDDHLSNYSKRTEDGKILKSSTAIIRDENSEIAGAICINYDLGRYMQNKKLYDDFCKTIDLAVVETEGTDPLNESVSEILNRMLGRVISDAAIPVSLMTKEDKLEIVKFLDAKEVFSIKSAVDGLAKQLNVSRYTIYNYLDEVRASKN